MNDTAVVPLLEVRGLRMEFELPKRSLFGAAPRIAAVDDVGFSIAPGTTFGLVGESGSGKTTVARVLLKLEKPTSGTVWFEGADLFRQDAAAERGYRRKVQAVLQDPYGALSQRMRIGTIVAEPLRAQGVGRVQALEVARRTLQAVGLQPDVVERYPHQFSGGQRQRIAIARALSVDPRLLVLDECVSALDVSVRAQVLTLLREMQDRLGLTYLFIGHDLAIVKFMSTNVGVMYFGRMVEIGASSDVFKRPRHPYTKQLVAVAAGTHALGAFRLSGEPPNPLAPPSGCHFRNRCPFAIGRCQEEVPPLTALSDGHAVACHVAVQQELGK